MEKLKNREMFLKDAANSLNDMASKLENLPTIALDSLDADKTMVFNIDLNKGFAKAGNLFSPRVGALITETTALYKKCLNKGMKIVAYSDKHTKECPELEAYPEHCMSNTEECELVSELAELDGIITLYKNSTNGFLAINPMELTSHFKAESLEAMDTFIISGCITEVCVYNFATTLKSYFNEKNKKARVIVPTNLVDTYDAPWHNADLMNVVFFSNMMASGIEVVSAIL